MKEVIANKKEVEARLHYLKDEAICMLWKYFNGRRFVHKNLLTFNDITPAGADIDSGAMVFMETLGILGIELEGIVFHKDIYLKYQEYTGYKEVSKIKSGKVTEAISRIMRKEFTFADVCAGSLFFRKTGMTDFFEFDNHLSKKIQERLGDFLDVYLDEFIADKLEIENRNFYRFDEQKNKLISMLKKLEEKYGNQFIAEYDPNDFIAGDNEYLFIHTLASLERLGYYTIQAMWVFDPDISPDRQHNSYKVRIILRDEFYNEISPKKSIPSGLSFYAGNSLLEFGDKHIEISKTRDSDPHYLLEILFSNKEKIWAYDEIWENPYFHSINNEYDSKKNWRKIYNAGYSVNEKVAKATTINDFLNITKTAISINRKYLK